MFSNIADADKKIFTYPLYAQNRRDEVRDDILDFFVKNMDNCNQKGDISSVQNQYELIRLDKGLDTGEYLEGTGSMVFDPENRIVYAVLSRRTSLTKLQEFIQHSSVYENIVYFRAKDEDGQDIYHTNVVMSMGSEYCIVCLDVIVEEDRQKVKESLESTGKELILLTTEQCLSSFAGNMMLLKTDPKISSGVVKRVLCMSSTAKDSLTISQLEHLQVKFGIELLDAGLDTIEKCGGGSARCMLAEIF